MIEIHSIPQFQEIIESAPVVLAEFYASWCPHCQAFMPEISQASQVLTVPVIQIEIDQNAELAGFYEIESIPTMILFVDGSPVARHVGALEAQQVVDWVNQNA